MTFAKLIQRKLVDVPVDSRHTLFPPLLSTNRKNATLRSLWLVAGVLLAGHVMADTFFVDSVSGNDSNPGTEALPWRTLNKVSNTTFSSGTTVYLARGRTWAEDLYIRSSGLTIDAYGTGALPTLDSSAPANGSWTLVSGTTDIYYRDMTLPSANIPFPNGAALGHVANNGTLYYPIKWNIDSSEGGGDGLHYLKQAGNNSYTHNTGNQGGNPLRLYIKVATDPNGVGQNFTASTLMHGVYAENKSNVVIKHLKITRFSLHGINFAHCVGCEARDSTISYGGGAFLLNATPPDFDITEAIYGGNALQWGGNSSNGVANNLTLSEIFDSGISPQAYETNVHMSNFTLSNSTIDKVGYGGVEIAALYFNCGGVNSSVENVTVSVLTITNSGRGWSGIRYGTNGEGIRVAADKVKDADATKCAGKPGWPNPVEPYVSGVNISNTWIANGLGKGVFIRGKVGTVTMNQNRITGNGEGIHVVGTSVSSTLKLKLWASGIDNNISRGIHFEEGGATSQGFELYHNTFYNNGSKNLSVRAPQTGPAVIKNNMFAGTYDMKQLWVENPGAPNTLSNAVIDYNCYSRSANMIYYGQGATPYSSLAAFNAGTGFESAGIDAVGSASNLTGLGLIIPLDHFKVTSSSVCIGRGQSALGVVYDYLGQTFQNPPASGAKEYYP